MRNLIIIAILVLALPTFAADTGEISPQLQRAFTVGAEGPQRDDGTWAVWVYFTDKDVKETELSGALAAARNSLSQRTLKRRSRVTPAGKPLVDMRDVPVATNYLTAVSATGAESRRQSKWLNAAAFNATHQQIEVIANLPFVRKIELVAGFVRPEPVVDAGELLVAEEIRETAKEQSSGRWNLEYGGSTATLEQINVPPVHELGLSGAGVIVAQLDAGFVLSHNCLQHIPIVAQYDFVHDDDNVQFEEGDHEWQHRHGSQVLSTIMGFSNSELVGPAYGASVILAMTEDTGSETPIEEDNWVAAVEWVEGLGADLITSSLGYYYWYTFEDMDGETAVATIAADMAVERGLSVFSSAGNEGENPDFPHMTAPADGDSVVACGAVDLSGSIAGFSSPGPTFDGRIKPDVSAQGVANYVASYYTDDGYMGVNGTSFSAPLVAGVATLMLERLPSLTPMQIREALRETASQAQNPDNSYGWGIIDAYAAVTYWGPTLLHDPLQDSEDLVGPYSVITTITSRTGLDSETLSLYWRIDGGAWSLVPLEADGGDSFSAGIPGQSQGGLVEYYLEAGDDQDFLVQAPQGGPANPWSFTIGTDIEPPSLAHFGLTDQVPAHWAPTLSATASDNIAVSQVVLEFNLNGGADQGPYEFTPVGDSYELVFPLGVSEIAVGDVILYTITAFDSAAIANTTISGPWEIRIVQSLGNIVMIDNSQFGTNLAKGQDPERTDGTDMAQWLVEIGYQVDIIGHDEVSAEALQGHDVVLLTCSNNPAPIAEPLLRSHLMSWVESGGKVLIEGGNLAYISFWTGQYIDFANTVLHISEHLGWGNSPMLPSENQNQHPVLVRPHQLEIPVVQDQSSHPYDSAGGDGFVVMPDAQPLLRSIYSPVWKRALAYDNNTGPEAGQIVYLAMALKYLDPIEGQNLVENSLAYLLAREAPGTASISGTVTLVGSEDASGVLVDSGDGHTTITGASGQFFLGGLHGSTYTMTASLEGYGPAQQTVILAAGEAITGVNLNLYPITEVNLTAAPELDIPDFDEEGITSTITVAETGLVNAINIDIDIEHPSIGQLEVRLTSPAGTVVTLHNLTGLTSDNIIGNWPATLIVDGPGNLEDFLGEAVQGDWTLWVADSGFGAWGTLHSWGLNLLVSENALSTAPDGQPLVTRLVGNIPNPFNPQTTVIFELERTESVVLEIFDLRGHHVRELVRQEMTAGRHETRWDGRDTRGQSVASGVYFYRFQAGPTQQLRKMTLVR